MEMETGSPSGLTLDLTAGFSMAATGKLRPIQTKPGKQT